MCVYSVRFKFRCSILITGKIIKEMPGSLASGTHSIFQMSSQELHYRNELINTI